MANGPNAKPCHSDQPYRKRAPRLGIITRPTCWQSSVRYSARAPRPCTRSRTALNAQGITTPRGGQDLEAELASLPSDMWATQKRLEEKGFRVDSGNKMPSGWWLTANNRNMSHGSIKVKSDGAKIRDC